MPLGKRIDPTEQKNKMRTENAKSMPPLIAQIPEDSEKNDKVTEFILFQAEYPQYSFSDIILNKSTFEAVQDVLALYEKHELLFKTIPLEQKTSKVAR